MSVINWILLTLIVILLCTLISISIYNAIAPSPYIYFVPTTGMLNAVTTITGNTAALQNFIGGGEGTLSIFVYLDPTQRTPTIQKISQKSASIESSSDLFENSSTSQMNDAINFNIFTLGSGDGTILTFKQYPSSSSGIDKAELRIVTTNSYSASYAKKSIETFPIQAIPQQKWVCLTLSRIGRRYTVFYNNQTISSFRTKYYPINSVVTWNVGDTKSSGYYAYPLVSLTSYTESDIKTRISLVADTRNKPILPRPSITNLLGAFGGCPNGIFCVNTVISQNPINEWSSPFA